MANKTVISDAEFKTYVEGCAPSTMGTVYMSNDSKYWMFTKEATDKINSMCVNGDDIEVWVYDGTDWITNKIPEVVDNLTSTSAVDALSAKQGKLLNEKFFDTEEVTVTINTNTIASGSIKCYKRGGWCFVSCNNIIFKNGANGQLVASGFPIPLSQCVAAPVGSSSSAIVGSDGFYIGYGSSQLFAHAGANSYMGGHWCTLVYPYFVE